MASTLSGEPLPSIQEQNEEELRRQRDAEYQRTYRAKQLEENAEEFRRRRTELQRQRRKETKLLKAEQEQQKEQQQSSNANRQRKFRAKKLEENSEEFRRCQAEKERQRQKQKKLQQKQPQPQPQPILTNHHQNSTGNMSDTIINGMLKEHGELNRLEDEEHQRRVEQMRRNNDSQRQLMENNQRDHEEYMDKNEAYVHQEFQSAQKKREDRFQSILNTAERMHGQRPSLLDGDQFYFDTNDGSNTNISSDLFGAKNEVPDTIISTPTKAASIRKNKASTAKKVQPKKAGATKAKAAAPTKRPGTGKKREKGTFYS